MSLTEQVFINILVEVATGYSCGSALSKLSCTSCIWGNEIFYRKNTVTEPRCKWGLRILKIWQFYYLGKIFEIDLKLHLCSPAAAGTTFRPRGAPARASSGSACTWRCTRRSGSSPKVDSIDLGQISRQLLLGCCLLNRRWRWTESNIHLWSLLLYPGNRKRKGECVLCLACVAVASYQLDNVKGSTKVAKVAPIPIF